MPHRARIRVAGIALAVAAAGPPLSAQERPAQVHVGDGTVDGSFLRAYASTFRLWRQVGEGDPEPFGRWTDSVRFVDDEGHRRLYRAVARYTAADVKDLWRDHLVDPSTMAPIRTLQRFGEGLSSSYLLEFHGDSLTVSVQTGPNAAPQRLGRSYAEPIFDLSLYAILLVGFPLAEGYAARFLTYGDQLLPVWETMRVTGRETVTVENGRRVEAWVVQTEFRPWTAWLTKEPPYIAKVVQRMPDGSVVTSERTCFSGSGAGSGR